MQSASKQKFESRKAWWEYLKSTAGNVVSKGHQKYEEMGSTVIFVHKALLFLEDQLLLTLMCSRLERMKQELADQFGISRSPVALPHGAMYLHLGLLHAYLATPD